jgi:small GTP-binding protein
MTGNYLFKIILAGSGGCGKTTLLNRYTTGQFNSDTKMTIGVDFAVHYTDLGDDQSRATLQIWDFGGEERFRTMLPSFCQGASGALLFFDLVRTHTFYELDEWIHIIRNNTREIPIILLGAKYDLILRPSDLNIDPQQIISFIKLNKIDGYLSISSKTGYNVNESFNQLTKLMVKP